MKGNELVWRTLVDGALRERRSWRNVGDLAFAAGTAPSTTYLALERLSEIGAVRRYSSGFSTVSPEKVLTLLCAWRNVKRDTLATTTLASIGPFLNTDRNPYALGGTDAANALLGGKIPVLGGSLHIVYLPKTTNLSALHPGNEVTVLSMDRRAQVDWDGLSSVAQTIADLFAMPGWQATETRLALRDHYFSDRDWHQSGDDFA